MTAESSTLEGMSNAAPGKPLRSVRRRPSGWRYTLRATQSRDFTLLWLSTMSMVAGYQMQAIAQGYLVYEMTRSAKILGLVSGMAAVPVLCLALVGGAFADRVPPKRLVQLGQACSMSLALFVAFSIITESVTWVHLAAAALMQGVAWSFMGPARQAMMPHVLPRNRIANGIALISAGMSAPALVAPAAAGLLYAFVGPEGVYFVVAGLGVIAVILSTSIRADTKPEAGPRGSVAADIAQGVSYIWDKEVVRLLLLVGFVFVFFSAPLQSLLPVLIVEVYQLESEALGLLVSMSGVGALVGTVVIAGLREGRRGILFVSAGVLSGVVMVAIGLIPIYGLAVGVIAAAGLGTAGVWSLNQILIMGQIEDRYRGRVMSIFMMNFGLMPFAVLPAGIIADIVGPQPVLAGLGVLIIVFSALVLVKERRLRTLR